MKTNKVGSVRSYVFGFVLSILLTAASYFAFIFHQIFPLEIVIAILICLAVFQLFVQLIFFLHLGHEHGPRWRLGIFISTVSIILLVVLGSLWIMYHLNYNMMSQQTTDYMMMDEGIQR